MNRYYIALLWACCLIFLVAGCASCPERTANSGAVQFTVSLPPVMLMQGEYIQGVSVEVRGGGIVSVNRLLDDWDLDVTWDNPGLVTASCYARHFSAGLSGTKALAEFITVALSDNKAGLTAKIHTSSCVPTGRDDRNLVISKSEMILKPVRGR